MANSVTRFPRSETAGARLIARPGPRTTQLFGEAIPLRLNSRSGWPDSGSRTLGDRRSPRCAQRACRRWSRYRVVRAGRLGLWASFPGRRWIPGAVRGDPGATVGEGHRARRVNSRKSCQARDRFLRYDGPGTSSRACSFEQPIAGDAAGWQGRPGSMMGSDNGNITIGHVWGIPIRINPSTLLILALVTWTLASPEGLLPGAYPELSATGRWLTALLTALLFFASILFHELAHAWVARRNGIPVLSVTLYIFGGIAQIGGKPKTPGVEFRLAAVGPASSLVLAAIFFGLNQVFTNRGYFGASSEWLAYINLVLALFNLCLAIRSTAAASWNRSSGGSPGNRKRALGPPARRGRSLPTG